MEMTWRKSSYSSGNGGECVEVGTWRKSSHSAGNGGECVEVGATTAAITATVAVRDTKDHGHGPVLRFIPRAWQTFTTTLK
jgi:hypothetical protein